MAKRRGKSGNSERLYFLGLQNHCNDDCSHEIQRHLLLGRKAMTNLDNILKKQRYYFADKGPNSKNSHFSSRHVWMRESDHKEGWVPNKWCFQTSVLERTLESPLDCKIKRRGWKDEMVVWRHWLNGHEFEQTPRDSEGQWSLLLLLLLLSRFSRFRLCATL